MGIAAQNPKPPVIKRTVLTRQEVSLDKANFEVSAECSPTHTGKASVRECQGKMTPYILSGSAGALVEVYEVSVAFDQTKLVISGGSEWILNNSEIDQMLLSLLDCTTN